MRMSVRLIGSAAVLACSIFGVSQEIPTISVNVKVVNVLATVRDKHGQIVQNLTKDDFNLNEDSRPQTIKYFTHDTNLPLNLGLLVDTSISQMRVLDEEKTASAAFTNDILRADKDAAFLIQFAGEAELLQDFTKSPLKVQSSLEDLSVSRPDDQRNGGGYPGGNGGGNRRGGGPGIGTVLYDAVYLASNDLMRAQQGRKALVILTDGVDHGSKMSLDRAIESAQRADTMVYTIYFPGTEGGGWMRHDDDRGRGGRHGGWGGGGIGWPGGGVGWPGGGGGRGGGGYPGGQGAGDSSDGKKVLDKLSKATGGRMFEVSGKQSITDIYRQIEDDLRNQYNLGYTPDRPVGDGPDYRHIQVTAKEKGLTVQARDGYYASKQLDSKTNGD